MDVCDFGDYPLCPKFNLKYGGELLGTEDH